MDWTNIRLLPREELSDKFKSEGQNDEVIDFLSHYAVEAKERSGMVKEWLAFAKDHRHTKVGNK